MNPIDEMQIRMDEGEIIAALLRECAEPRAADLVAARLGGYRDALAAAGLEQTEEEADDAFPGGDNAGPAMTGQHYAAAAPAPKEGTPAPPARPHSAWTAERLDLFRRLWAEGVSNTDILAKLNKLPGNPVPSLKALENKRFALGLPPRHGGGPKKGAIEQQAESGSPKLSAEEEHEARSNLRKGWGALQLQEWFGGELAWWQDWCGAERKAAAA